MKRFEHKLPRMTSPMRDSRFTEVGLPHRCGVRLTCNACGRDIKHDDKRGPMGWMLIHLNAKCVNEAALQQGCP